MKYPVPEIRVDGVTLGLLDTEFDARDFHGLMDLCYVGTEGTVDGEKKMLACFVQHFCKKPHDSE